MAVEKEMKQKSEKAGKQAVAGSNSLENERQKQAKASLPRKSGQRKSRPGTPAPASNSAPSLQKPGGNNSQGTDASTGSSRLDTKSTPPKKESPAKAGQGQRKSPASQQTRKKSKPKTGGTSNKSGSERPKKGKSRSKSASSGQRSKTRSAQASSKGKSRGKPTQKRQSDASRQKDSKAQGKPPAPKEPAEPEQPKELVLPETITIRDLSQRMGISPIDVIKELMDNGIMANINQLIDFDTAAIIAEELGFTVTEEKPPEVEEEEQETTKTLRQIICEITDPSQLEPRPPVVTVLGHVDHGKTTLLDAIRQTQVVETEAGGITQRIGAYQIEVNGKKITFLDTPGHEAFTAMRARGAQVTDLAVLVVAADDGVMPQTREAIDHARAAQVPILVALNKIDKPNANPDLLKQQLADLGLVVEDWGGDVICIPVSAKLRQGIDELLENILLVTEVAELKANPNCPAIGTVVEGKLDKTRGPMATVLVQNGTLYVGDTVVVGTIVGRVRAMFDDKGASVKEAPPSTPVAVLGLPAVPVAGEIFEVFESEREARAKAAERAEAQRKASTQPAVKTLSLEDIASQIKAGHAKELNIVLKADAQGSIEPIINSLEQLGDEDLHVRILHTGTGNISESDVMLAAASHAIVVGFAVRPDNTARKLAEQEGVDIRLYDIIYMLIEDMDKALRGLLEPKLEKVVTGHAEVREVFRVSKVGKVAGCYVTDGAVTRDARVRVLRNEEEIFDGTLLSLKRFTEDVKEVNAGYECGIGIEGFSDIQAGDILEFYKEEQVSG